MLGHAGSVSVELLDLGVAIFNAELGESCDDFLLGIILRCLDQSQLRWHFDILGSLRLHTFRHERYAVF